MKTVSDDFCEAIENWAQAYPLDVFPKPDMGMVREALEARGITIDAVSAANMRHVITSVAGMLAVDAREVPEGCTPTDAAVLRSANHALAEENHAMRHLLTESLALLNHVGPAISDAPMHASKLQARIRDVLGDA